MWVQQNTVTAVDNITTATYLYHTVMASVATALATANAEIVYLKSKLKTQSKPAEKTNTYTSM